MASLCECCSKAEVSCKVVLNTPKGVLILLDTECEELKLLEEINNSILENKVELREGGEKMTWNR